MDTRDFEMRTEAESVNPKLAELIVHHVPAPLARFLTLLRHQPGRAWALFRFEPQHAASLRSGAEEASHDGEDWV